jgi:hypothetical protein
MGLETEVQTASRDRVGGVAYALEICFHTRPVGRLLHVAELG